MAVTARKSTRPAPGSPHGNVEKSLCTRGPAEGYRAQHARARPKSRCGTPPFRGAALSEVDDSALQTNGDGMRPIVCGQLGEDVLDVALDGFFSDGELGGDHLVRIPAR